MLNAGDLTEIVPLILSHHADVNVTGRNNGTALHWAIDNWNYSTMQAILYKGPGLSQFVPKGDTAFSNSELKY
ncbi:hypothetical protein N7540_005877 [Penicillium herquei]|nr:hypothetical protein N7540_005877 [Penicillium herquei]